MGVPKFFRYMSERYPCLNELVKEFQLPDFDNLYLDMNGIIHACSHPNDFSPHFSISEADIFANIFHYVEVLFNMIKPKKLFFMAVDGVAPRAKMNQQRARRFRSAKEAEMIIQKELRKNENFTSKEMFDSNCITPGTVFMDHLHSQLKYFITSKISTDPLWQNCKIILSGHQTPGEGEHKIMDYIRYLKTLPDYDDNTKHCLYGLDADLIMLGLCTHEPHFTLLREKVLFKKQHNKRIKPPDEMEFYLLHLSLMREYLDLEFQNLKETLPFEYNLESIIDDWILMGFLVGNDFVPHLPDLHINKGALPIMYTAYKEVLPTLDGYLNENGYLNLPRFQKFMERLGKHDLDTFEETYSNLSFLEEKIGKKSISEEKPNGKVGRKSDLEALIKSTEEMLEISDDEVLAEENEDLEDNGTFLWEFCQHKRNYYTSKLDYSKVTPEVLQSQAEGYIRAIQWNLHYYYQGCQSWSWYYPHHYSPYISDITNFKDLKLDFEMGRPFLPFEQLLAVLPAASKNLLPAAYQDLMTSPNSPIKDFYPIDFETDLNGKDHEWEAVVLIPFIDEKRLLNAMEACSDKLTPEERKRNRHGPMHVYTYTEKDLGPYKSDKYFPVIVSNHAEVKDVYREEIAVEISQLKYGLRPGVLLDVLFLGFPTLKHIPYKAALKPSKVKVFEAPSRGYNMILMITPTVCPPISELADDLLGKIVYVHWPYLTESRVVALSDGKTRFSLAENEKVISEPIQETFQMQWRSESLGIQVSYQSRLGIEIGAVDIIVYVKQMEGVKYVFGPQGKIALEKQWSTHLTPHAFQTIVKDTPVQGSCKRYYLYLKEAFPPNSVVFMLGQPHFGSEGRVLDSSECWKNNRLSVALEIVNDPNISDLVLNYQPKTLYVSNRVAALKIGISPRLLSRIAGVVLISMTKEEGPESKGPKVNIGLNLKFFKKNEEIPGYTKKEKENWLYSKKAIDVIAQYVEKFSRVIDYLSVHWEYDIFVQDIFPGDEGMKEMRVMVDWIKNQEFKKLEKVKCGTAIIESEVVAKIEEIVNNFTKEKFTRTIQVKPHLLYKSDLVLGNIPPVESAKHFLLDRVVHTRSSGTVPTGMRGFIIGIHPAPLLADYMYDVLFDEPFLGASRGMSSAEKVFRMSWASFINISDAKRKSDTKTPKKTNLVGLPDPSPSPILKPPNHWNNSKNSAFVQWLTPSAQTPLSELNKEFQKLWLSLQKPQEEPTNALKKILKIEGEQNVQEEKKIEDPVKSFFEKVTQAPKDALNASSVVAPITHDKITQNQNVFLNQLFSYCQKRNLGQPRFQFLKMGSKVIAQIKFSDGRTYSGVPCDDKESACENASFQAWHSLKEVSQNSEPFSQKECDTRAITSQAMVTNTFKINPTEPPVKNLMQSQHGYRMPPPQCPMPLPQRPMPPPQCLMPPPQCPMPLPQRPMPPPQCPMPPPQRPMPPPQCPMPPPQRPMPPPQCQMPPPQRPMPPPQRQMPPPQCPMPPPPQGPMPPPQCSMPLPQCPMPPPQCPMPPILPTPPSQWVGLSGYQGNKQWLPMDRRSTIPIQKTQNQSNPNPQPNRKQSSALEFVPLQAIAGKRYFNNRTVFQASSQGSQATQKRSQEVKKPQQVTANSLLNWTPSSSGQPKRKPKIAANLGLDPNLC